MTHPEALIWALAYPLATDVGYFLRTVLMREREPAPITVSVAELALWFGGTYLFW